MSRARDLYARITAGGYDVITQMIMDRETEELFLDYKRSANSGNGTSLDNGDKANLSKAISGFANSEGGVIVWGVDCRTDRTNPGAGDVPQQAMPVTNVIRFKSLLENAVSGATVPAHDGVQHSAIPGPNGADGFVVTLIPKGNHPPYQTVPDLSFKMRAGSNFAAVPRAVLAGMFGQFPQPVINPQFITNRAPRKGFNSINLEVGLALRNVGLGIASEVYVNVMVLGIGGSRSALSFQSQDREKWTHSFAMDRLRTSILNPDGRLPPEAFAMPLVLDLDIRAPFDQAFNVIISAGAKGAAPTRMNLLVPPDEMMRLFAIEMPRDDTEDGFGSAFVDRLLKVNGGPGT